MPEAFESGPGGGADGDDWRGCGIEKGTAQKLFHFEAHDFERVGIDQIGFGENGEAAADVEHAADVEVLAGLRFDRFIGGDHENDQVDAADAGQHVAHEALVAGDIDKAEAQTVAAVGRGQF